MGPQLPGSRVCVNMIQIVPNTACRVFRFLDYNQVRVDGFDAETYATHLTRATFQHLPLRFD